MNTCFIINQRDICAGVNCRNLESEPLQCFDQREHLGIAGIGTIFFKRHAEHIRGRSRCGDSLLSHEFQGLACHKMRHAVVDAPTGKNDLGLIADHLGFVGQVVRVNADAVPADKARLERQEIPLAARRIEHITGIDVEPVEEHDQFIYQGDIEIPLCVFNNLRGLSNPDARRPMDTCRYHFTVKLRKHVEGLIIISRHHLGDCCQCMLRITRINAFWRVAYGEVFFPGKARGRFKLRHADLLCCPGIDR